MTGDGTQADASANLRAWVDAAEGGGYPTPMRSDRWQALRAGVVGLWEFDTIGRSGKKFRYYVEPTRADGDRRTSEASTHRGWLWVEYGRLVDDAPRYFTTLLFSETRSAAADVKLSWCTVEGSARVRESFE